MRYFAPPRSELPVRKSQSADYELSTCQFRITYGVAKSLIKPKVTFYRSMIKPKDFWRGIVCEVRFLGNVRVPIMRQSPESLKVMFSEVGQCTGETEVFYMP